MYIFPVRDGFSTINSICTAEQNRLFYISGTSLHDGFLCSFCGPFLRNRQSTCILPTGVVKQCVVMRTAVASTHACCRPQPGVFVTCTSRRFRTLHHLLFDLYRIFITSDLSSDPSVPSGSVQHLLFHPEEYWQCDWCGSSELTGLEGDIE